MESLAYFLRREWRRRRCARTTIPASSRTLDDHNDGEVGRRRALTTFGETGKERVLYISQLGTEVRTDSLCQAAAKLTGRARSSPNTRRTPRHPAALLPCGFEPAQGAKLPTSPRVFSSDSERGAIEVGLGPIRTHRDERTDSAEECIHPRTSARESFLTSYGTVWASGDRNEVRRGRRDGPRGWDSDELGREQQQRDSGELLRRRRSQLSSSVHVVVCRRQARRSSRRSSTRSPSTWCELSLAAAVACSVRTGDQQRAQGSRSGVSCTLTPRRRCSRCLVAFLDRADTGRESSRSRTQGDSTLAASLGF